MNRTAPADPRTAAFFRPFFLVAAFYDILLGVAFFFLYRPIFERLGVPLPDNTSYVHITAAYVFVQGLGYWYVSRDMVRNLDLVKLGIVYKAIYILLAFYYLAIGELLSGVFVWFAVFDAFFLLGFVAFLRSVRSREVRTAV